MFGGNLRIYLLPYLYKTYVYLKKQKDFLKESEENRMAGMMYGWNYNLRNMSIA